MKMPPRLPQRLGQRLHHKDLTALVLKFCPAGWLAGRPLGKCGHTKLLHKTPESHPMPINLPHSLWDKRRRSRQIMCCRSFSYVSIENVSYEACQELDLHARMTQLTRSLLADTPGRIEGETNRESMGNIRCRSARIAQIMLHNTSAQIVCLIVHMCVPVHVCVRRLIPFVHRQDIHACIHTKIYAYIHAHMQYLLICLSLCQCKHICRYARVLGRWA